MTLLNPSIKIINRTGDKAHPGLKPLEALKVLVSGLFINTKYLDDTTDSIIQLVNIKSIPFYNNINLKNSQSTLSSDFTKSNFDTTDGIPQALIL